MRKGFHGHYKLSKSMELAMVSFWRISLPSTFQLLMLVDFDLLFKSWFIGFHIAFFAGNFLSKRLFLKLPVYGSNSIYY